MKKSTIIGISIFSIFILCSISYQPILAEKPTKMITQPIKETNNDCGCNNVNIRWNFPIICSVLGVFLLIAMILCISLNFRKFCDVSMFISDIMSSLNCW